MDKSPTVSVVIPAHRRLNSLKRALKALNEQSYKDFDIIVVASPGDESLLITRADVSQHPLKILVNPNDKSLGRNVSLKRNYGVLQSKAQWVAFIDDDCVPDKDWLKKASQHFENKELSGIEGLTLIPEPKDKTHTWKGLQRLSQFGGYQTCNIFYRKKDFLFCGGFDHKTFPWYLEDTDIAWAILKTNQKITPCKETIVHHPVGPAAPWRLTHEAKWSQRKLELCYKHPKQFADANMRILRPIHWVYLLLICVCLISTICPTYLFLSFSLLILLNVAHMLKNFWGLKAEFSEIMSYSLRTLTFAPIALVSTLIYFFKNRPRIKLHHLKESL